MFVKQKSNIFLFCIFKAEKSVICYLDLCFSQQHLYLQNHTHAVGVYCARKEVLAEQIG